MDLGPWGPGAFEAEIQFLNADLNADGHTEPRPKIQDSKLLGILVLGPWFLGPGCIEVFIHCGFNAGICYSTQDMLMHIVKDICKCMYRIYTLVYGS